MEPAPRRALVLVALIAAAVLVGWVGWTMVRPAPEPGGVASVRRVVPAGERVIVEVLNGSGRRGVARIATRVLRRAGFDVVYFGNAPEEAESTLVLVRRGEAGRGDAMIRALGSGILRSAADTLRRVDLTVILGKDWKAPAELIP